MDVKTLIALALQLACLLDGELESAQVFCFAYESELEKSGAKIANEFARQKTARLIPNKVHDVFHFAVARLKLVYLPHNRRPPRVPTHFCPHQITFLEFLLLGLHDLLESSVIDFLKAFFLSGITLRL